MSFQEKLFEEAPLSELPAPKEILRELGSIAMGLGKEADRIAAARLYLEKLMLLYSEFEEGAVPGFDSEIDLLRKTVSFHNRTRERFEKEFGGVIRYMRHHFRERWDIDANVYEDSIEKNINYLKFVLKSSQKDIYHSLRRNAISFQ